MAVNKKELEWLDNIHDQTKILREDAYYLKELSSSFGTLGNTKVSQELGAIADNMLTAQKEIGGNIGKMLSDQVNAGQKEMGNMLRAVLGKV